jgi:catechol 2,3-dioxygenase-like lactoylglutathione lyase family enzyme
MDRPAVAIGHVVLRVADISRSAEFYRELGLRSIVERKELAILELRGGTHLLLFKARGKPRRGAIRSFDFMVDSAQKLHEELAARGVSTSEIREDRLSGHSMFEITDPDGHVITVLSDHTEGRPV